LTRNHAPVNTKQATKQLETVELGFRTLYYEVALNGYGWRQGRCVDGMASGARGATAFVTAFRVFSPEFEYRAYLRGEGWSGWRTDGADSNDFSIGIPLEALQFRRVGGVPGLDLLYRAMFGKEFGSIGAASSSEAIGTSDSGDSLQVLQIFPVVPVYAQSPGDLILRAGSRLEGLVRLDNPSLNGAGRGSLEDLHYSPGKSPRDRLDGAVLHSKACLAGIGTVAPLRLETAGLLCYSGLMAATVRCARAVEAGAPLVAGDSPAAQAGTRIADPELGTVPGDTIIDTVTELGTGDRWQFDAHSLDIRSSACQLLKPKSEGGPRKGA
jgi:hypothetical protein